MDINQIEPKNTGDLLQAEEWNAVVDNGKGMADIAAIATNAASLANAAAMVANQAATIADAANVSLGESNEAIQTLRADLFQLNAAYQELRQQFENGATIQRRVLIQNNLGSKSLSAQRGEPCVLDFTFISQERTDPEAAYENTGERGLVQIAVRNLVNENFTVVKQIYVMSGVAQSVDVGEYLANGANAVSVKATGELTGVETSAYLYSVQLTSLSVSAPNFAWWSTFTSDITLPLQIGGNVSKKLYVEIASKDEEYSVNYEVNIGTAVYTETAYNYVITKPDHAGVYTIRAWLGNQDGTISTRPVTFDVMVAAVNESSNLIAINHIATEVVNYQDNELFEYAVTDGGRSTTSLTFTVKKDGVIVYQPTENAVTTNEVHRFSYPMEIETDSNEDFDITVEVRGGEEQLAEPITFSVNNAHSFSAAPNASFYLNPRKRSNGQSNRAVVVNDTDSSELETAMQGFNWSNDGWVTDSNREKVLRVLSGSSVEVDYSPFAAEVARRGITLEFDYKSDCVTDFSDGIIQLVSGEDASFVGLKILPDDIVLYSSALKDRDKQSVNVYEGSRLRVTAVIMPNVYGNAGFNLAVIYVNGVKNREFQYQNNDYFAQYGKLAIGSDGADVDIYGIRVYDRALTSAEVLRNYINWLPGRAEKLAAEECNDVMNGEGTGIDIDKIRGKFNLFVIGSPIPYLGNPNTLTSSWQMMFADHPEWNWEIDSVPIGKQGTSSSYYWRWNLRGKLAGNCTVTYADSSTTTGKVNFTPQLAGVKKLTAKKNFASSMQSHKMGGVNSITDLHEAMELYNEAHARISTYQVPALGFSKSVNEEGKDVYEFIGLYTIGPDKGDAATFGYNKTTYPDMLSIEGSDNAPLGALFRVPYNTNGSYWKYNVDEEALQYNGTNCWDYNEGVADSEDASASKALFDRQWAPTYNFIYSCSDRILPFEGTPSQLNLMKDTYKNTGYEYWVTGGDLYYYEPAVGEFIPSDIGEGTINLYTQLVDKGYGLTSEDIAGKNKYELNNLFITARIVKFRLEAESVGHIDIQDSLFAANWVLFNAATDNRAKNTYPYILGNPSDGFKWRWRHDDVDTVWSINNQGESKKGYWVEMDDTYENGGAVWNGVTSVFWNLLDLAFPEEGADSMRRMLAAMESLGGLKSGSSYDKIYAFYDKYYFSQAQRYFSETLYNEDTKWTYEVAKLAYMRGDYTNDTDPIAQALGDHYSAEQRWIRKRILYMMSKYSYGVFSTKGTDNITVRAAGDKITYELTPAMWMYPSIANGTTIIHGARTEAGQKREIEVELGGSGDQQNIILGASYLEDIGDWHDKNVTGAMIVKGRMLRRLKLGDESEPITISITSLTISDCISLQELDLRSIETLTGVLDLTTCYHLKRVFTKGTSIVQLILPDGGGLEEVQYNELSQYITLKNFPILTNEGVDIEDCKDKVTDFFVANCESLEPIKMLLDIVDAQKNQEEMTLKRVRVTGFNELFSSPDTLDKLGILANGSIQGLNAEGVAGDNALPVLDGTITVDCNAYEDVVQELQGKFPNLTLNVTGGFYVRFKDDEVLRIALANWDNDGNGGLTSSELAAVTTIGTLFKGNTLIKSFDELAKTSITTLTASAFEGCSRLMNVSLPSSCTTLENRAFTGSKQLKVVNGLNHVTKANWGTLYQTSIEYADLSNCTSAGDATLYEAKSLIMADISKLTTIGNQFFHNCTSLIYAKLSENLTTIGQQSFRGTPIRFMDLTNTKLTTLNQSSFQECAKMKFILLPATLTTINGWGTFNGCNSLQFMAFHSVNPPTISNTTFQNTNNCNLFVPDTSVDAYKAASNWSSLASRIQGLSHAPAIVKSLTTIEIQHIDGYKYKAAFTPAESIYDMVRWSVESGSEYALVNNGKIIPKKDVVNKNVTIKATSIYFPEIFAEQVVNVTYQRIPKAYSLPSAVNLDGSNYYDTEYSGRELECSDFTIITDITVGASGNYRTPFSSKTDQGTKDGVAFNYYNNQFCVMAGGKSSSWFPANSGKYIIVNRDYNIMVYYMSDDSYVLCAALEYTSLSEYHDNTFLLGSTRDSSNKIALNRFVGSINQFDIFRDAIDESEFNEYV